MSRRTRIALTAREFDTVLAALRLWQRHVLDLPLSSEAWVLDALAKERGPHLSADEIDTLCERLNLAEEEEEEMSNG
jgi:hypothetical protein